MPKPLTATALRGIKPPPKGQVEHADGACPGLRLRVSQGGAATWVLGCRDAEGRARRFRLGDFPTMGLAEARVAARNQRVAVRAGQDPIQEARAVRQRAGDARLGIGTLAALLDAYALQAGAARRSWPEARRRVEHVFAAHLQRSTRTLEAQALQMTVDAHPARGSAGAAVRYLRPVLKWGAKRGLVPKGVGEALDQPHGALKKRARRLSSEEIAAVLSATDRAGTYGAAIRLLFLTAARLNEVCGMAWADVDLSAARWTLARTKTGAPHVVPLPRQAVSVLQGLRSEGDRAGLIFATSGGKPLANWDRATKALQATSGTTGWHRHDIRRSVASLAGDLGVAPHVVEVILGHALGTGGDGSRLGGAATVYNRSRYGREHAQALQQVADELDLIEHGAGNVVRLGLRA
jgi:integrase